VSSITSPRSHSKSFQKSRNVHTFAPKIIHKVQHSMTTLHTTSTSIILLSFLMTSLKRSLALFHRRMKGRYFTYICTFGTFAITLHGRYRPLAQEPYEHENSAESGTSEKDDAFRYHDSTWVHDEDHRPANESQVD
jgi:hypothetical protein